MFSAYRDYVDKLGSMLHEKLCDVIQAPPHCIDQRVHFASSHLGAVPQHQLDHRRFDRKSSSLFFPQILRGEDVCYIGALPDQQASDFLEAA